LVFVLAITGFFGVQSQAGVLFNFVDFSNTAGLTQVGNTSTPTTGDGTVLRVTPAIGGQAGAAYSTAGVTLGSNATFSTTFDFRFTNTGGIDPADGITFVLAASPTGLGVGGGGIGYLGVPNSVAIEFDTFNNGGVDGSSNHVAIDTDGVLNDSNLTNLYSKANCNFTPATTHSSPGCMSNGDLWSVTIGYDGTNLSVSAWDRSGTFAEAAPFMVYSSLPLDISSALGTNTAFVGFTSGTGAGFENHDILNWQFANTTQLVSSAPEPATLAMLMGGFAGLALLKRRQRWQR
jgi:hypothetical protein